MPILVTRVAALATLIVMCTLFSPRAAPADAGGARPRAALVIGNASYSAVNPLKNPSYDAHDMCDALGELGYTASCFVDVKDAREFKARIQDFAASLKPKSEVLFYYAGHAVQVRGENYLVPVGAKLRAETDVARETVSLNYIMTQLLQAKHYVNIVILDACRSNPWPDNPKGMSAGLAPITAIPRGTMVMYATAANDVSDDGEGHNGTLTKNLLANIKLPGLTADEFFKHVSEGVQADSAAAVGHTQTPALYTNFTGEFCFAGCIDKVARAELEKIQKANELQMQANAQQLEQMRKEKAEAEAKLASAVNSMSCDKSVLNDTGQCFNAPPEKTLQAVAQALLQKGYRIRDSNAARGSVRGERSIDDAENKSLTDVLSAEATVKAVPISGNSVVTITAIQKTVLHDEYQKWGNAGGILPLPTSKEYQDVVKKEVNITDAAFYSDLLAAVDRNLRGDNVAAAQVTAEPAATSSDIAAPVADTGSQTGAAAATQDAAVSPAVAAAELPAVAAAVTAAPVPRAMPVSLKAQLAAKAMIASSAVSGHQQKYAAPPAATSHALLEVLVARGYVVDTFKPEFGLINATHKVLDKKDDRISINTDISASVIAFEGGSQVQMSANARKVAHRKPGSRIAGALLGYEPSDYRTVVKDDSAVEDAAFYRDLLGALDANLHGAEVPASAHARRFSASPGRSMRAAADGLSQQGFSIVRTDEKLGLVIAARRVRTQSEKGDGWSASYFRATIYVKPVTATDSVLFASASVMDALFRVSKVYAFQGQQLQDTSSERMSEVDCQAAGCPPEEMRAAVLTLMNSPTDQEIVIREGEPDAKFYGDLFSTINQKVADTGTTSASAQ